MEKEIMKGRKRKIIILLTAIIILIATVVCIVIYNNTAWKRNFEIKYLGFDAEHEIYLYSITNLTQKTYKDVKAIISVDNPTYGNFSFESYIGTIRQYETIEYELYFNEAEIEAEEQSIELFLASLDIERLIWS